MRDRVLCPCSQNKQDRRFFQPPAADFTPEELEKYSSAVSLSDMEVFIFPELIIALALANIMSPILWSWKEDPWFAGLEKLSPYRKALRVKQFIIDRYAFNLDLDTWGLTTKAKELARFGDFVDQAALAKSNALFGYEGDKYYFDMDIRRHFGLDKYNSEVIPYWKTETIEAMTAFHRKEGHDRGAGECVSFSVLYYAALFVLADIPLEDMYMMATPLHSQNYIDLKDGVLTNNRRLVTKAMWRNGTELSAKARRALENEEVTIVCSNEGYVHTLYPEATMPQTRYQHFRRQITAFLDSPPSRDLLVNFLRQAPDWQTSFQFKCLVDERPCFAAAETVYAYESGANITANAPTLNKLAAGLPKEALRDAPIPGRVLPGDDLSRVYGELPASFAQAFQRFCRVQPRLPGEKKIWRPTPAIDLRGLESRADIIDYLRARRVESLIADLAFMAYRDMALSPWEPFLKAAFERNPVCLEAARRRSPMAQYEILRKFGHDSIYDGTRLAQPDEVWNFKTGDGIEKAITMWALLRDSCPERRWVLEVIDQNACLSSATHSYCFPTAKGFEGLRLSYAGN
ncbi:MAG: hypothetical protein LBK98_03545 [Peptococcaceae bacterium]|jgi:hypothetical protein|nr:hypothetical protein [Peptococcaceae bacterium]